jgi:hypothetical protein
MARAQTPSSTRTRRVAPTGRLSARAPPSPPILTVPLSGPAYIVSHGGAAFPDVEFVLEGQGVQIILDGKTDIKKGITYSRFETVPDACGVSLFDWACFLGGHRVLVDDAAEPMVSADSGDGWRLRVVWR